jgi:hypothetical protein
MTAMADQREVERIVGIIRENARATLAKPQSQRQSHLAFCRNNWKRYAEGLTWRKGECERFAAAMDQATRDLMTMIESGAAVEQQPAPKPWGDHDSVEGGMESVLVYEAAIPPADPGRESDVAPPPAGRREAEDAQRADSEAPPPVDAAAGHAAEEEDLKAARYGFSAPIATKTAAEIMPEIGSDGDLQRRVRAVLRAHQQTKSDDDR